jgi:biotin carboxyl carrier protein
MTFEIEINGRMRSVSIERAGDRAGHYRATIDGEPVLIDAQRTGDYGLSLIVEKKSVQTHVTPRGSHGAVLVSIDGFVVDATVNGRRTGHAAETGAHAHGEVQVIAPMPGRVVRLLVSPGDEVAAKQGVVVVEAMKMENELRAPKAGRVKDVAVTPGTSVDAGRVLVTIE